MKVRFLVLLLPVIGMAGTQLRAQVSVKALPYSFQTSVAGEIPTVSLSLQGPQVTVRAGYQDVDEHGFPLIPADRHAVEVAVDLGFDNAGRWLRLPDGGRLWRLRIRADDASSLHLMYDDFWMPPGGRFFLYNDDRSVALGAFTEQNNKPHRGFATDFVPGPATILEYYEPSGISEPGRLHIATVGVRPLPSSEGPYVPTSLPCSINVACREGSGWEDAVNAVVRLSNGCTGVLVNNVRQDETPYVLTVNHCGSPSVGDTLNWVFHFNDQSATCADPTQRSSYPSVSGAIVRAAQAGHADFTLLELMEPIPASYKASFSGWSVAERVPASGVVIGHPRQDIKKISIENDPIRHHHSYWSATIDHGSIEVGSSGSPLFDEDRLLVGLVRSGSIDHNVCSGPGGDDNRPIIFFPKLSYVWTLGQPGERLADFLDPDETGQTTLPSLAFPQVWISEVNADARSSRYEQDEFVELAGPAGTQLDGYTLEIYDCANSTAALRSRQPLDRFTFENDYDGVGFFVIGGVGVDPEVRDQSLSNTLPGFSDVLPNSSGRLVLLDETGKARFNYQYDTPMKPGGLDPKNSNPSYQCPADLPTRSRGDAASANTMGFLAIRPSTVAPGLATLRATPGKANEVSGPTLSHAAMIDGAEVSDGFLVEPAFPNPFNPQTLFRFAVGQQQPVRVELYDLLGRRVSVLYEAEPPADQTQPVRIDGSDLPSGLYLVRLQGRTFTTTQRVMLLK